MLELNAWNRGMRLFLVLCCALLVSCNLYAQQPLQTSEGRVVGTKIMVSTQAPYCILFPDETRHGNELITLARKINNLGANVLLVPSVAPYLSSKSSADSLVADMGWRVAELRKHTTQPIFLFAEHRVASAALIAATQYFAIKGVIAVSAGEYFAGTDYVARSIPMLRVPVLALSTEKERAAVKGIFASVPRHFLVHSTDLSVPGFVDLLNDDKHAGKAWLAVSVFYHEHFER